MPPKNTYTVTQPECGSVGERRSIESSRLLVGAVGIEIASLTSKSFNENGVALPPSSNWSRVEPTGSAVHA